MKPSKKDTRTGQGDIETSPKIQKSPGSHVATTRRSRNETSSMQKKHSTSRASYNISTHAQSEPMALDSSNMCQTSDALSLPIQDSQMEADLLGLASQTFEDYQPNEAHQAFIQSIDAKQSGGCLYHLPILQMRNNVGEHGQGLDPMARWLAEGHTEQCTVLHLLNGQLSIHKECQCNDMLRYGTDMEIEE